MLKKTFNYVIHMTLIPRIALISFLFVLPTGLHSHGSMRNLAGAVVAVQDTVTESRAPSIYSMRSNINAWLLFLNFGIEFQALDGRQRFNSEDNAVHGAIGLGIIEMLMLQYVSSGHFRTSINFFPLKSPWKKKNDELGNFQRLGVSLAYDLPTAEGENHRFIFGIAYCLCELY